MKAEEIRGYKPPQRDKGYTSGNQYHPGALEPDEVAHAQYRMIQELAAQLAELNEKLDRLWLTKETETLHLEKPKRS